MDNRITWGELRVIAEGQHCEEGVIEVHLGEKIEQRRILRKRYGDVWRMIAIPMGRDDERIDWKTLRSYCITLGIPPSALGVAAAHQMSIYGV